MSDKVLDSVRAELLENWSEYLWAGTELNGLVYVDEVENDSGRWVAYMTTYIQHVDSGRHFGMNWARGLTEMQETEGPEDEDDIFEVVRTERKVVEVVWEEVK